MKNIARPVEYPVKLSVAIPCAVVGHGYLDPGIDVPSCREQQFFRGDDPRLGNDKLFLKP